FWSNVLSLDKQKKRGEKMYISFICKKILNRKWKIAFVDSLTHGSPLHLKNVVTCDPTAMLDQNTSFNQVMQKMVQRAFFYLEFPLSLNVPFELKESLLPKEIQAMMITRLRWVLKKNIPFQRIVEMTKKKVEQVLAKKPNESHHSFIQLYQTMVNNIIALGWTRVLLSLYENCYFQVLFTIFWAMKNKNKQLINIFVASAENKWLVPLFDKGELSDEELHLCKVKVSYRADFPFSWNFHIWCHKAIGTYVKSKSKRSDYDNEEFATNTMVLQDCNYLNKSLNGDEKPFRLLTRCSPENCEFYAKDVIRGNFHMYLSVKEDDQLTDIIKGVVFCLIELTVQNEAISIPLIETIFYYFKSIITKYVHFLSLCDDETVLSSLKKGLSADERVLPLNKLINVSCILAKYILTDVPQKRESEFIAKMDIACDATKAILKLLRQQPSPKEEIHTEFLVICRQLHMKTLGIKHMRRDNSATATTTINQSQDLATMLDLVKHGFVKDANVIPEIIKSATKHIITPGSETQTCLYFVHDLLHVVQAVEYVYDKSNERVFQDVLKTIFFKPQHFVRISSCQSLLKLQALRVLVENKWTHVFDDSPELHLMLNRVNEKLYANAETKESPLDRLVRTRDQKISVVSQLKVQLTKHILFLAQKMVVLEHPSKDTTFRSHLEKICKDLTYFHENNFFDEMWKEYEYYLHIWFIKQCCMLKNMDWTHAFFSQKWIQTEFPLFNRADVFSQLRQPRREYFSQPFNDSFGKKFKYFKQKLISNNYNCYTGDKQDIPPLLTAALSISSALSNNSKDSKGLSKIFEYLQNLNFMTSKVEETCIEKLLSLSSDSKFLSSNFSDTTDEAIACLSFHWFGVLQIMKKNPFKFLLNEPKEFGQQRKPGERSKTEATKTTFTTCYCRNRHPFFVKEYQPNRKVLECPDPWCNTMVDNTEPMMEENADIQIANSNEKDEKQIEEISPITCTLLLLLNSLTMLLRNISNSEGRESGLWKETKGRFLLLSKMTIMKEELLCVALHDWFCGLPQWFNKAYLHEMDEVNSQSIEKFERDIETHYFQFLNKFKKPNSVQKALLSPVPTKEIDREIKEENSPINSSIPQLFLVTRIISSENLLYKFYNNPELPKQYPLLFHTLKSIDNLEYVKYLTGIGQWTKHCHLQFSGILTKKECKTKTITSIINDSNNTKCKKFWQQLVKCWNRFNDRTPGVSQLSQNPKDVHFDYCVLQASTPGRLIVNIIEILQKINNNFLQSVHSYCRKAPMRKEQRTKNDSTTETKNAVSSNQAIISKSLFEISNRDIVCVSNTM
ncbi:hypothetical protein RFI_37358, partial [Reticulomyxa filosa]